MEQQQQQQPEQQQKKQQPLLTQEQIRSSILERVRAEKERLSTMPPRSQYVLHRSRVIRRAEQLIAVGEETELMALLEKLAI